MAAGGEKRAAGSSMTGLPLDREGLRPHESVRPSRRAVESSQLRRPALFRSKDVARRMPSDDPPEAPYARRVEYAAIDRWTS